MTYSQAWGLIIYFPATLISPVLQTKNVNVDTILQKTKLELDENGTKAAAVTAVIMECMSAVEEKEPVIKNVELTRPFAFLIYDRSSDEILFMGKVMTVS